jgi:hypothetical protein
MPTNAAGRVRFTLLATMVLQARVSHSQCVTQACGGETRHESGRISVLARLVSQVLVGRLSGGIRALRIEMRLGSFGACVCITGTMAKQLHVYRFADQHCAKTAHSHDLHGHSARLAPKLKGTPRIRLVCLRVPFIVHSKR